MRFVAQEHIDAVVFRGDVVIEEAKLLARPKPQDLLQVASERTRAGRMPNVVSLPREGRHQVQGDDRLPGPGAALHQYNRLLLVVIPTSQQAQNCIEDHLLLVQQHIFPPALDYRTDMIEKFLARFVLAGQNKLESLEAVTRGQVR